MAVSSKPLTSVQLAALEAAVPKSFWDAYVPPRSVQWRLFEEARNFARSLGLKSWNEWNAWCKSDNRPQDIPTGPNVIYRQEWKGWGDWLGTGNIAPADREYWPF